MGKHLLVLVLLISMLTVVTASLEILGDDTDSVINLGGIVDAVRTFLGLDDVLETSYVGQGGFCVQVNPGETGLVFGNCSNSSGGGSGDITAVNAIGPFILGGGVTGSVDINFSRSQLESETLNQTEGDLFYVNVAGDNMTGNLNTTGNITANTYFGDGSQLTGIIAGGNPFDQDLNTTNSVTFDNITLSGSIRDSSNSVRMFIENGVIVVEG